MAFSYVPVLPAKKGEFTALDNLALRAKRRTLPLFELPARKAGTRQIEAAIARTARAAGAVWSGRPALLDIAKWRPNDRTESQVHVLEFAFDQFSRADINVVPVIGYDRWGDPEYRQAVTNVAAQSVHAPVIRVDRESIQDDVPDFDHFADQIEEILDSIGQAVGECPIILDFGYVAGVSLPELIGRAELAISVVKRIGFQSVVIVGGSMPVSIDQAVSETDSSGYIPRLEMMAWRAIVEGGQVDVGFGDYCVRCPNAIEGVPAVHANAKIRYTVPNQFFIVRGHSKMLESLEIQHRRLAEDLISSVAYVDPAFSWGDSQVMNCAMGAKAIRESTTMIAVDSSHHVSAVIDEILEHRLAVAPHPGILLTPRI